MCGRSFISEKKLIKHITTYHKPGAPCCTIKREKTYVCLCCGKRYPNEKSLINHTLTCLGNIFNSSLPGISNQDTDDSSEVEICRIQTDSTLPGNPDQLAHSVSEINEESTVHCGSQGGAVVMSEPKPYDNPANNGDLGIIL